MDTSELLPAIGNFALYFGLSLIFIWLFKWLYTLVTPHDEWKLIREQQNIATAIGFGGAVIGFAIALSGALTESVSIIDFAVWAAVALVAQLLAFAILRFGFMPKIVERMENNEVSAGVILAAVNIAVGLLNSASMSY
jgi:putative membrane protein